MTLYSTSTLYSNWKSLEYLEYTKENVSTKITSHKNYKKISRREIMTFLYFRFLFFFKVYISRWTAIVAHSISGLLLIDLLPYFQLDWKSVTELFRVLKSIVWFIYQGRFTGNLLSLIFRFSSFIFNAT